MSEIHLSRKDAQSICSTAWCPMTSSHLRMWTFSISMCREVRIFTSLFVQWLSLAEGFSPVSLVPPSFGREKTLGRESGFRSSSTNLRKYVRISCWRPMRCRIGRLIYEKLIKPLDSLRNYWPSSLQVLGFVYRPYLRRIYDIGFSVEGIDINHRNKRWWTLHCWDEWTRL